MRSSVANPTRATVFAAITLGLLLCLEACSGDSSGSSEARVSSIESEEQNVPVGDATVVNVEFTFDAGGVFEDENEVSLVVRLSPEIAYVNETSEIQGLTGDDPVGAEVTVCGNGETFLVYRLDEDDLDTAENPDGDADARLTLTVQGLFPGSSIVSARAGDTANFSCSAAFDADSEELIPII